MTYPGGKNGGGAYQRIINYMPPHDTYIEGFLGSGAVLRNKKPANTNIAIDRCSEAISLCNSLHTKPKSVAFLEEDIFEVLFELKPFKLKTPFIQDRKTLLYLDPPYLPETRKSGELYNFELSSDDHHRLLNIVTALPCMVMISGYRSALYGTALCRWTRIDYKAVTRQGMVDEALWMNFDPPKELHDYRYLGENFRERERIKRKKQRWKNRLEKMDRLERLALMEVIIAG